MFNPRRREHGRLPAPLGTLLACEGPEVVEDDLHSRDGGSEVDHRLCAVKDIFSHKRDGELKLTAVHHEQTKVLRRAAAGPRCRERLFPSLWATF